MIRSVWLVACLVLPGAAMGADATVLESFDNPGAVTVSTGQLTRASAAPVATTGAACTLSGGGTVRITIPRKVLQNSLNDWLLLDTRSGGPGIHPVKLAANAGESWRSATGYVAVGTDTLALPANQLFYYRAVAESHTATLDIQNLAESALVIDNLRLQPAAPAPQGTVLFDPGSWAVWPGFSTKDNAIRLDTSKHLSPHTAYWPDPLRGDATGASVWGSDENAAGLWLTCSEKTGGQVWAWVAHYGRGDYQPTVSAVRVGRRTVWQSRRSAAQLLSTESVFEGADSDWSLSWLLDEFAPSRVEKLSFAIPRGTTRVDLINSQLCALVMAPARQRREAGRFIESLEKDLARYARQFLLRKQVPMVAREKPDAALTVLRPSDPKLATPMNLTGAPSLVDLAVTLAPGRRQTTPLVLLPGPTAGSPVVRADRLRAATGALLARTAVSIDWLDTVTALSDRQPVRRPWRRAAAAPKLRANEPLFGFLNIECDRAARPGVYAGNVVITLGHSQHAVALTVTVHAAPPDGPHDWTFGVTDASTLLSAYGTADYVMSAGQQNAARQKIWKACADFGLNAVAIRGASYGWQARLQDAVCIADLRGVPAAQMTGKNLAMIWDAVKYAKKYGGRAGGKDYIRLMTEAPGRTLALSRQARLADTYACIGYARTDEELTDSLPVAEAMRSKGIRPAMRLTTTAWRAIGRAAQNRCLRQFEILLVDPNDDNAAAVLTELTSVAPGRILLLLQRGDRYAAGFYAWAVHAAGAYAGYVFSQQPSYNALYFHARALLQPTARGQFAPTVNFYHLRQGIDDYLLLRACSAAVDRAKAKGVDDQGLGALLGTIRKAVLAAPTPEYSRGRPATTDLPVRQLDQWRDQLIPLAGRLAEALKGK